MESEYLTSANYVIVAAPSLMAGRTHLSHAEIAAMPWVVEPDWPEAFAWLKSFGLKPETLNITYIPTEELALSAARQGYGPVSYTHLDVYKRQGQTRGDWPYSVAEHSLLVEEIFTRQTGESAKWRLAALLHDAPEYVIGDMISPVKACLLYTSRCV